MCQIKTGQAPKLTGKCLVTGCYYKHCFIQTSVCKNNLQSFQVSAYTSKLRDETLGFDSVFSSELWKDIRRAP